jgi:two-component system chemotaxis response regulator CheB
VLVRVVVIDDSPLSAEALRRAIEVDPRLHVEAVGHDGLRAVELAARLKPTVITMDVHMPRMNGLEAIARIMRQHPTRILVVTEDTSLALPFEALHRGALDVVRRPPALGPWAETAQRELRERILGLAQLPLVPRVPSRAATPAASDVGNPRALASPRRAPGRGPLAVVGVAASTGGPAALAAFLTALPRPFPVPILVVQHLAPGFVAGLAAWLERTSGLPTAIATEGALLRPGHVLLCPDHVHLTADGRAVRLLTGPPIEGHRPSGSRLFLSLAQSFGDAAVAVVLTGMGRDGAAGVAALRAHGAPVFVQDEPSSVVFGMPRAAAEIDPGAEVGSPERLARSLGHLAHVRARGAS